MAKEELERMQGMPLNDDSCKNMSSTAARATAATATAAREDVRAEKKRNSSYYQKKIGYRFWV